MVRLCFPRPYLGFNLREGVVTDDFGVHVVGLR